jgi:Flp pilus assembly protein TadB
MHMTLTFAVEIALMVLLAATLVYCMLLERKLAALRDGQDGLKETIGELNGAISAAGQSMRALKAAANETSATLDEKLTRATALIDELSVITSSGERIAERITNGAVQKPSAPRGNALPSGSVMGRLDSLRAVR